MKVRRSKQQQIKLGYSGLRENLKKVVLCFLEGNYVFVSLYTQIICWIQFYTPHYHYISGNIGSVSCFIYTLAIHMDYVILVREN